MSVFCVCVSDQYSDGFLFICYWLLRMCERFIDTFINVRVLYINGMDNAYPIPWVMDEFDSCVFSTSAPIRLACGHPKRPGTTHRIQQRPTNANKRNQAGLMLSPEMPRLAYQRI